jgi:hypothetical protein
MAKAKQNTAVAMDVPDGIAATTTALVVAPPQWPALGLVARPQPGLKARQLYQEAKKASLEHVSALQSAIGTVETLLDDVVEGGEIYAPGLSDFAGRLKEELFWKAKTLEALAQKQRVRVEQPHR